MEQEVKTAQRTPEQTVREALVWYNKHDFEKFHGYFSPEYTRYSRWAGWRPMNLDSYKAMWNPFMTAFPDLKWEIINLIPSDIYVTLEVYETGTFLHPWEAAPGIVIEPTGKNYKCRYCCVYTVKDGLITSYTLYEDSTFTEQLGCAEQFAKIAEAGTKQSK